MSDSRAENIVDACEYALNSPSAADFIDEIRRQLDDAQKEIDASNPACDACGKCCMFEQAGHRLYVSTGELALLMSSATVQPPQNLHCLWQQDGKCFARDTRPLGCRVYYCKSDLSEMYEKFHRKIVEIHKKYDIEYFYAEMTSAASEAQRGFFKNLAI